jgi:lipopolysaccharide transport protein LptA
VRLWPNARPQGHEVGEVWRVGYYSRCDGLEAIWLVNGKGEYVWTVDEAFLRKHFEVVEVARERSIFGRGRPRLGPLPATPRASAGGSRLPAHGWHVGTTSLIGLVGALLAAGCATMSTEQPARREPREAAPRSSCPPIVIDASRMENPERGRLVIFTGDVVARLDGATMTADRMEVYLDEKRERVLHVVSSGNVKVVTADGRIGTARRTEYDDDDRRLLLLGDASVLADENVTAGDSITIALPAAAESAHCTQP